MSEAKQVTTAFGTLILIAFVAALSGLLGRDLQSLAVTELVFIAALAAVLSLGLAILPWELFRRVGQRPTEKSPRAAKAATTEVS